MFSKPGAETAAERPLEPGAGPEGDLLDHHISQLKQQLADAKERFLSAIEAHQTSCEESQNATEEALSANEELQSLNEELETAKEELQSTNEELITLNDELQAKNAALAQARDFAMSIVETVRQPLLVLDPDLRIKMANKAFYRAFQVVAAGSRGTDGLFAVARQLGPSRPAGFAGRSSPGRRLVPGFRSPAGFSRRWGAGAWCWGAATSIIST